MLNDDSRGALVRLIESKQKSFERATQDAQEDFQIQRGELISTILKKMAPVIQRYFDENHYSLLLDTSEPWPRGLVILSSSSTDITQQIVEAYNTVPGVPSSDGSAPIPSKPPANKPPKG